jgi:hypothetical protein
MSLFDDSETPKTDEWTRPIARERPEDPAGTKPRHDPSALLPASDEPLLRARDERREAVGEEPADELPPGAVAEAPHAARFQFAYGILIGVAIASLAAAVIIFSGRDDTPKTIALSTWSSWQPTQGNGDPVQQIVDHVAP